MCGHPVHGVSSSRAGLNVVGCRDFLYGCSSDCCFLPDLAVEALVVIKLAGIAGVFEVVMLCGCGALPVAVFAGV